MNFGHGVHNLTLTCRLFRRSAGKNLRDNDVADMAS